MFQKTMSTASPTAWRALAWSNLLLLGLNESHATGLPDARARPLPDDYLRVLDVKKFEVCVVWCASSRALFPLFFPPAVCCVCE
jgi:hypothetical protein